MMVSTATFPLGTGQFIAGDLNTHEQVSALFSNFTWTLENSTVAEQSVLNHWKTEWTNVYITLACYSLFTVKIIPTYLYIFLKNQKSIILSTTTSVYATRCKTVRKIVSEMTKSILIMS